MRALEEWQQYLEGCRISFMIWSNYKNLEYFMTNQNLNRQQARWTLYLSRFNFIMKH